MKKTYTKRKKEWYPHIRTRAASSCMWAEEGYMTVFACMLFLVVSSLLFACLDASIVYQGRARHVSAQSGLGEHLLANYSIPLKNRYNLYFLDPRMGNEELEKFATDYYAELFSFSNGGKQDALWNLKTEYANVDTFGTMQENDCRYFSTQISEAVKYDTFASLFLEKLNDSACETEQELEQLDKMADTLDEKDAALKEDLSGTTDDTLTPSEDVAVNQAADNAQNSSPVRRIQQILEDGILSFVTDTSKLSERNISSLVLPYGVLKSDGMFISIDMVNSLQKVKELLKEQNFCALTENAADRGHLGCYIKKYFNSYAKENKICDTCLFYEAEYILGGRNTDKENLEYTVNRLVLLRYVLNTVYSFGDEVMNQQAMAAATVLTGAMGNIQLTEVVKYLILSAVNLIESVNDVKELLGGKSIPLFKDASTWNTSIQGETGKRNEEKKGLFYEDYLIFLLLFSEEKEVLYLRMQNLMQVNIQQGNPGFQIRKCMSGINIVTGVSLETPFYHKKCFFEERKRVLY